MTMIDERVLRSALRCAADAVPVPDHAIEDILAVAARDAGASAGVVSRFRRHRHRVGAPHDVSHDVARDATDDIPGEPGPRGEAGVAGPPPARHQRRMLVATVAAGVAVAAAVSVTAVATLGGSPTSTLGAPAAPGTTVPGRGAVHRASGALGGAASPSFDLPGSAASAASSPSTAPQAAANGQAGTPPLPTGAVGQSSKVEETGSLDLTVGRGRLGAVLTRLTNLAVADGGFVAGTQTQSGGGPSGSPSYGSITLQVPQAGFATVVAQAQTFGKVTALSTKGTDVTGQYVDLQARIAALQASRDQYLTIMTRASSIADVLAVQNQLDSLQTQIEQLQGQLQVLDGQTAFSTLAVTVSEPGARPAPVPHARSGIAAAWHGAVSGFAAAFDGLVRAAGPALFALLCLAALALLGRLAWRGVRRRTL